MPAPSREQLEELMEAKRPEVYAALGASLSDEQRTSLVDTSHRLSVELGRVCTALSDRDPELTWQKMAYVLTDIQRSIRTMRSVLYYGTGEVIPAGNPQPEGAQHDDAHHGTPAAGQDRPEDS